MNQDGEDLVVQNDFCQVDISCKQRRWKCKKVQDAIIVVRSLCFSESGQKAAHW